MLKVWPRSAASPKRYHGYRRVAQTPHKQIILIPIIIKTNYLYSSLVNSNNACPKQPMPVKNHPSLYSTKLKAYGFQLTANNPPPPPNPTIRLPDHQTTRLFFVSPYHNHHNYHKKTPMNTLPPARHPLRHLSRHKHGEAQLLPSDTVGIAGLRKPRMRKNMIPHSSSTIPPFCQTHTFFGEFGFATKFRKHDGEPQLVPSDTASIAGLRKPRINK